MGLMGRQKEQCLKALFNAKKVSGLSNRWAYRFLSLADFLELMWNCLIFSCAVNFATDLYLVFCCPVRPE